MCDVDADEITECLHTYIYNCSTGPLWCSRLLPVQASSFLSVPSSCLEEDVETRLPHCYYLFLGFHHSIGDATGFTQICGTLVSLMDDVIAGNRISDEVQLGNFDPHEEFEHLLDSYRNQSQVVASEEEENSGMRQRSALVDILHGIVPDGTERKTLNLTQIWDPATTSHFFKRCKEEDVTVNSGYVALANMALADVFVKRGVVQDTYNFDNFLIVSLRRYWSDVTSENLAVYTSATGAVIETSLQLSKEQFWDLCRSVNKSFHENLRADKYLPLLANRRIGRAQSDHSFNNMGDVTKVLAKGQKNVQIALIARSATIHNSDFIWEHSFQTFKGCLINTFIYNNGIVPTDVAKEYTDNLRKHLRKMI